MKINWHFIRRHREINKLRKEDEDKWLTRKQFADYTSYDIPIHMYILICLIVIAVLVLAQSILFFF